VHSNRLHLLITIIKVVFLLFASSCHGLMVCVTTATMSDDMAVPVAPAIATTEAKEVRKRKKNSLGRRFSADMKEKKAKDEKRKKKKGRRLW
jgi:hypothetical protein